MEDPTEQQLEQPLSSDDDEMDLHTVRMRGRNEHDHQDHGLIPMYQDDYDSSEGETEDSLPPLVQRSPEPIPSPVEFEGLPPGANTVPLGEYLRQEQLYMQAGATGVLPVFVPQREDSPQDRYLLDERPRYSRAEYERELLMLESRNVRRGQVPALPAERERAEE